MNRLFSPSIFYPNIRPIHNYPTDRKLLLRPSVKFDDEEIFRNHSPSKIFHQEEKKKSLHECIHYRKQFYTPNKFEDIKRLE